MDFDGLINWITETLPAMLSLWFVAFIAFAKLLWGKTVDFVSVWFEISVAFFKQAWMNFPALMADWGGAFSEFAKGLRKSYPELLPDSVLPVLDSTPDWVLFIVAPLVVLLMLVLIFRKIFTESEKKEKHLKSVENPEVPTFGAPPLPAERAFVEDGHADNGDTPESGRVDPVILMERQAPTIEGGAIADEVLPEDPEELQAPTTIGPTELQTRIREQLGIDERVEETLDQQEANSKDSDAESLLDTSAERDVSVSLNKLRRLRSDAETGSANLNITGISEAVSAAQSPTWTQEGVEPGPIVQAEPAVEALVTPPLETEQNVSGGALAAMSPDATSVADEGNDQPSLDELETVIADISAEEEQIEPAVRTGVPAPPGPLFATLARLEDSLRVNERLAAQNPASAQTQRDVAIGMSRLADALVEAGDLSSAITRFEQSLAISERLAEQNPASAEALRDVAVSLNRLGDALVIKGEIEEASAHFEVSLTISQRLAEQSPSNAQAQRDVWISLNRIGDMRAKAGDVAGATAHFETGLEISQRLAGFNPANVEAQRDLIVSCAKLGEISPGQGWWTKALTVCEALLGENRLPPHDDWMLEDLRRRSAADVSL